jgi:hypothetical protein
MKILGMAVLALAALPHAFGGTLLTYTFTGTAAGTIGSATFSGATVTVTATADSSAVTLASGTYDQTLAGGATSFTIGGLTSGTFSDTTYFFDNNTNGVAGFGDDAGIPCCDTIQMHDSSIGSTVFATYNLQTPLGPIGPQATDPSTSDWLNLNTSVGSFTITSYTNFTFQVTSAAAVPEPSTFLLLGASLAALTLRCKKWGQPTLSQRPGSMSERNTPRRQRTERAVPIFPARPRLP